MKVHFSASSANPRLGASVDKRPSVTHDMMIAVHNTAMQQLFGGASETPPAGALP